MDWLGKSLALVVALVGAGGALVAFFLTRFVIPQVSVAAMRTEMQYYIDQVARKDAELAQLRKLREGDLARLEVDEAKIEKLRESHEELAAWNYGAGRYMKALEGILAHHGIVGPDRIKYGINGIDE